FGGHDADDGEVLVVVPDIAPDHRGVGPETALPQMIAEDHFPLAPRLVLTRLEAASESRLHAEHVKEICRRQNLRDSLRLAARAYQVRHAAGPTAAAVEVGALP